MVFDFGRNTTVHTPSLTKGEPIDIVEEYKYLGLVIDKQLSLY
jgi:hypothetical protein